MWSLRKLNMSGKICAQFLGGGGSPDGACQKFGGHYSFCVCHAKDEPLSLTLGELHYSQFIMVGKISIFQKLQIISLRLTKILHGNSISLSAQLINSNVGSETIPLSPFFWFPCFQNSKISSELTGEVLPHFRPKTDSKYKYGELCAYGHSDVDAK